MNYLIVLNKDEDTVSYIDLNTHQTVKKISTDYNPHEVVISPDKKKTFVTCSLGNSLYVISNETLEVIDVIKHEGFNLLLVWDSSLKCCFPDDPSRNLQRLSPGSLLVPKRRCRRSGCEGCLVG